MRLAWFYERHIKETGRAHSVMSDSFIHESIEITFLNSGPDWIFNVAANLGAGKPRHVDRLIETVLSNPKYVSASYADWDYCTDGNPEGDLPTTLTLTEEGAKELLARVKSELPEYYPKLISTVRRAIDKAAEHEQL